MLRDLHGRGWGSVLGRGRLFERDGNDGGDLLKYICAEGLILPNGQCCEAVIQLLGE